MNNYADFYEIVEQQCVCEGTSYTAYGIKLNTPSCSQTICDISTDKSKIASLVEMFNENDLAGTQFCDAVEDFMAAC